MRGQSEFRNSNSIVFTISFAAAVALLLLLVVVATRAQNPVPPTAREAAASPAFAAKLHPAARPALNKPQAAAHPRTGRASPQDGGIYDNGPINGTTDAWTINFGYIVSDTFVAGGTTVTSFDLGVWEFPGDTMSSLQWSITSSPNGGTVYGSGTVSGSSLTDKFISTNQYGWDIDKVSASGLNVNVTSGSTYWVNVFNATVSSGYTVYWDENSGAGCHSSGCPSQAVESDVGTIPSEAFEINGSGPPPWPPCFQAERNLEIIHDFNSQADGGNPFGGLVADPAGNVYGPMSGGSTGFGFVYEIASRNQGWVFNTLYNFTGGSNGANPNSPIVGPKGVLYGTASGGIQNCGSDGTQYCGLIFSLRPAPTACRTALCPWTENVVYQPTGNNDAPNPGSLVFDQEGNLYGTSGGGGAYGSGAVFELTPSPGGWTKTILYSFTGGSDGGGPGALIVGIDGNLYGITFSGGSGACSPYCDGVVFQLVRPPSGDSWTENVIHSFGDTRGWNPYSLVQDPLGNLFGLANIGNGSPGVDVFMLSPSQGSWVYSELFYIFTGYYYLAWSETTLAADAAGDVYWGFGYVTWDGYELFAGGSISDGFYSSPWSTSDRIFFPSGTLGIDANRNVYGTTAGCGKYGQGTIWKVTY